MPKLTAERLRELVHYDPETGVFTRLVARGGKRAGTRVGNLSGGRWGIRIDKVHYQASRLAFLYMTGNWPTGQMDHANLDASDDRWANIRAATPSQNTANQGITKHNKSGFKGVSWHGGSKPWRATIRVNGRKTHLGCFLSKEEAAAAYARAATGHFGEFARIASRQP